MYNPLQLCQTNPTMDPRLSQLAAIALKEREAAHRMVDDAITLQERSEAAYRVLVGQLRLNHIEPDYPVSV